MTVPIHLSVPSVDDMHELGRKLARLTQAGDLIVLTGELGVGKTQLAQGIGEGLDVIGAVISPTFVLSRIHRSQVGGPMLVHVDAYRLTSRNEIDDLDLEEQMPLAVTVVEWGGRLTEHLSDDRLEVFIQYSPQLDDETRQISITPVGSRWDSLVVDWEQLVDRELGRDAVADVTGDDDD